METPDIMSTHDGRQTAEEFALSATTYVDSARDELIGLCRALVETPSCNPPGDTRAVADVLGGHLRGAGVDCQVIAESKMMPNLVATCEGSGPGPHLILNGHMDTLVPGDESQWHVPIFKLTRDEGRLYGLGIGNMKGADAALCLAFEYLAQRREAWPGRVTLTLVSDEITFGTHGAEHLLATRPELIGDGFLSGEGPGHMDLALAEKGVAWMEVEAQVPSGQAAVVHEGTTAIAQLAQVIVGLDRLNSEYAPPITALQFLSADRSNHGLRLTANVGEIFGGGVINQIAAKAVARVDLRLPPGMSLLELEERLSALIKPFVNMRLHRIKGWDANWTPPDRPLPMAVASAAKSVRGSAPKAVVRLPASDASRWRRLGVDAVCFGPQPTLAAGVDDYALEEDIVDCTKIYILAADTFLHQARAAL
jgi:succinyl-diaminopimelate desuccinylase